MPKKYMKPISVYQMTAEFLKAELHSSRFRSGSLRALKMLGYEENLLESPNLNSQVQNEQRSKVLGLCRGWPDEGLFTNFPSTTQWFSVAVSLEDLKNSYRLKSDENMTLADRSIRATADRVSSGEIVKNIDSGLIFEIKRKIEEGQKLPPIIITATRQQEKMVLLEGHSRSVAYATFQELNFDIPAIIGISDDMNRWAYF